MRKYWLPSTIINYIELHRSNEAINHSKEHFFQQQPLTMFLEGLRESLGSTIRVMRSTFLALALKYILEENNIRYLFIYYQKALK